jgi:Fic family protein
MPARHDRAEKKKKRSSKAPEAKRSRQMNARRGTARAGKVHNPLATARAKPKAAETPKASQRKTSVVNVPSPSEGTARTGVADAKGKRAAGPPDAAAARALPMGKSSAAKASNKATAHSSGQPTGSGGKGPAVAGSEPSPPAAKAKATKGAGEGRRSTLRPAPPLKQYKFIGVPSFSGPKPVKYTVPPPPPAPPPPPPASIEERVALVQTRLAKQDEAFRQRYLESLDMSWIYHDSALEGVVYSFQELKTAIDSSATVVQDSSLQPACEEIRRHKQAIEFVRDFATKKRLPVTLDVVKRIYLVLHPEEGDLKTLKYRKDIPQHRLYFHEYAPPDKIAYKVRQIVDWINDPETKRGRNALRIAARAHYDLLRVFPFTHDSGKVARLLMNMLLMRAGFEPAIIHSTERQRYYEALKGSAAIILHMVQEAEENGLASTEKMLDEHETNTRSFVS